MFHVAKLLEVSVQEQIKHKIVHFKICRNTTCVSLTFMAVYADPKYYELLDFLRGCVLKCLHKYLIGQLPSLSSSIPVQTLEAE